MNRETLKALHVPGRPLCVPGMELQLHVSFALKHPEAHDALWMLWAMHMKDCAVCGCDTEREMLVA